MDRTNEFLDIIGRNNTYVNHLRAPEPHASNLETALRSGFNAEAAKIGQEIHLAQLRLEELGKCMKSLDTCIHPISGETEEHFQRLLVARGCSY